MMIALMALALGAAAPQASVQAPTPMTEVLYDRMPTRREVVEAYPSRAWNHRASGMAVISCAVTADGRLSDCLAKSEDPSGEGFAAAALRLAPRFRIKPAHEGQSIAGGRIEVPVRFLMPPTS